MPNVTFTPPTAADIDELATCMRAQDVAEVQALGFTDLRKVVTDGVRASAWCWTARINGELAAIFGVAPLGSMLDPRGAPWLLGTDMIPRHRRIFTRCAHPYIAQMLDAYPQLINVVHARNTVATRWLQRMGFTLQPAQPFAPYGEMFHPFQMTR